MNQPESIDAQSPEQLDYLLRRAEQESVAAIRSVDPRAAELHAHMASAYSAKAMALLGEPGTAGAR